MNCPEAKELLWRCAVGELESGQGESLREHLSLCPVCSGDYKKLQEIAVQLAMAGVPSRSAAYWQVYTAGVMERVRTKSMREVLFSWKFAVAAALVAIFTTMGIYHKAQQRSYELNEIIANFEILENLEVLERKDFDEFIRKS